MVQTIAMLFFMAVALGLVGGSMVAGAVKREGVTSTIASAACVLAGLVGGFMLGIGLMTSLGFTVVLGSLGVAYLLHPMALHAMVRPSRSVTPYAISLGVSVVFLYVMFR